MAWKTLLSFGNLSYLGSVLVEYDSLMLPYKGFYYLINWTEERQYPMTFLILCTFTRSSLNSLG